MPLAELIGKVSNGLAFINDLHKIDPTSKNLVQHREQTSGDISDLIGELETLRDRVEKAIWFSFEIPGRPRPWNRPKMRGFIDKVTGKPKAGTFKDTEQDARKDHIGWMCKAAMNEQRVDIAGEGRRVELSVDGYFKRPVSGRAAKIAALLKWFVHAPDIDNVGKLVLDGLNHVAYHDDRQVVEFRMRKLLCDGEENEKTVVKVRIW